MARATGLEPAASGVTGRRSNQLSYARALERARGPPKHFCYVLHSWVSRQLFQCYRDKTGSRGARAPA